MRLVLLLIACTPPGFGNDKSEATLTLQPFTLAPGEEKYVCQDFANPFGGDASVSEWQSHLTAGAHHLIVFYKEGARNGALESCSGNEFAAGPYGSQRLDDSLRYPAGVAASIPAGTGLRVQAHFLNATQTTVQPMVTLSMKRADSSLVQPAAVLFMSNLDIHVAAGAMGATAEKSCTLPWDVKLIQASGHMHRHGTSFVAKTSSQTLFQSNQWQDVAPALFDPPVELSAGTDVQFTCTYDNPGSAPLEYGESAQTNEMCIFTAQFYPAPFGGWSCF